MTANDWAGLVLAIASTFTIVVGGLRYLEKVRIHIGISRAEARLVFEEVKQENRLQTQTRCPHCAQSLMIKHPPGHVHVHSVKSRD